MLQGFLSTEWSIINSDKPKILAKVLKLWWTFIIVAWKMRNLDKYGAMPAFKSSRIYEGLRKQAEQVYTKARQLNHPFAAKVLCTDLDQHMQLSQWVIREWIRFTTASLDAIEKQRRQQRDSGHQDITQFFFLNLLTGMWPSRQGVVRPGDPSAAKLSRQTTQDEPVGPATKNQSTT